MAKRASVKTRKTPAERRIGLVKKQTVPATIPSAAPQSLPQADGWNPSPLTVLLIILGCILLLGLITAAIKVFVLG